MNAAFALQYAARSLRRGGQRSLLAVLCVAFGVLSFTALRLLSSMLAASIAVEPRLALGGDATLSRAGGELGASDLAALEALRRQRAIAAYTLVAEIPGAILQQAGDGRGHFLGRVLGVDSQSFPLVGALQIHGRSPARPGALWAPLNAVVLSRDVAERLQLTVGDTFTLARGPDAPRSTLRLVGIADLTPDRQGDTLFCSLATARLLTASTAFASAAPVLWGPRRPPLAALRAAGWMVTTSDQLAAHRAQVVQLFAGMLKAAGILGLLLGGLGVAQTLHVLMGRRKKELATLRALGYERSHLTLLLLLEGGLVGGLGGLLGAAAGAGLATWLRLLLVGMGPILLGPVFDLGTLVAGVAVGTVLALLFSLQAAARASAVRPATLLRELPAPLPRREVLLLHATLFLLFTLLAAAIMGSLVQGAAVVAAAFLGLAALSLLLGGALLLAVILPLPLPGVAAIARSNLRRQPARALVALVALFCGVFTIGVASAAISSGRARVAAQRLHGQGLNLSIHAPASAAPALASVAAAARLPAIEKLLLAPATARLASGRTLAGLRQVGVFTADPAAVVTLVAGRLPAAASEALAPASLRQPPANLALGETIDLVAPSGAAARVVIGGFFAVTSGAGLVPSGALLGSEATVRRLGGSATRLRWLAAVPEARLATVATALGRQLPAATVLTASDLGAVDTATIESLFAFVLSVAGLAVLAGAVLIANSVALAMLERRREMAIFKAIGYSSERLLLGISVETGALGLLAGGAGVAAVAVALHSINRLQPLARLALAPGQEVTLVAAVLAVAVGSAIAVAWGPTHVRPLDVLRGE